MRYSVYVAQEGESDSFLMSSDKLESVKKDQTNLRRWIYEMGVGVPKPEKARYVVADNGVPVFERHFIGASSRSWLKIEAKTGG